jgi:outer membrane protein insertion porin family
MVPLFGDEIPLKGDIPAKVEVALEYLLQEKGLPGSVQIMGAGAMGGSLGALQFSVKGVRLVIQQVEFTGAQAVEPATLVAAVHPLLASDYDQSFVSEFVRKNVGPLYARLGYLKVAFGAPQVRLLAGSAQDLAVTIPVAEGAPYRLREMRWEGNQAVPTHELATHVSVMPGQPADTVQMEKDLDGILQLYAARGYIAARLSFAPEFDDDAKTVAYHVQIQEGDRYSMGKLEIAGLDPVRAESLRKTSELVPGQPYNRAYWNTFISKSGRLLPASRTPWKATPKETIHAETKTVDVTLTFAPDSGQ